VRAQPLDLAALVITQQFAGAADLEVVGGQHEACPQVLGRGDGIQALLCVLGDRLAFRGQQVGVGLMV